MADILSWLDLETTGLDASKGSVLEVACILTDPETLTEIGEPFHAVVAYSPEEAAEFRAGADPFVQSMHDETGLWARVSGADALPLETVDAQLRDYIAAHAPAKRQARVAGSSVRLDLNFMDVHLPVTAGHLHYRSVDVSAIAYDAEVQGLYEISKAPSAHEALADIRASLQLLRDVRAASAARATVAV